MSVQTNFHETVLGLLKQVQDVPLKSKYPFLAVKKNRIL